MRVPCVSLKILDNICHNYQYPVRIILQTVRLGLTQEQLKNIDRRMDTGGLTNKKY